MLLRKMEGYVAAPVEVTDVVCSETSVAEDVDELEELVLEAPVDAATLIVMVRMSTTTRAAKAAPNFALVSNLACALLSLLKSLRQKLCL